MKNINICVVAGTHGNEYPLGALVHEYLNNEVPGKTYQLVGNPRAVKAGKRFIDCDLNRSFRGDAYGYEAERAEEIQSLIDQEGFTHVIDIHTSPTTENIVGVRANGCSGERTDNILNCLPEIKNIVDLPNNGMPHSLVGYQGNGGIGLECSKYNLKDTAQTIAQGITRLTKEIVLPRTVRTVYLIDGQIPVQIELPNGKINDFEEIPEIGGYAFVATSEYKESGANHQGMRASNLITNEI